MPLYDYQCRNCGAEFDMLRSIKDDDSEVECPYCHEKDCEKKISLVASDYLSGGKCGGGGRGSYRFG